MKRKVAFLLAALMVLVLFSGCAGSNQAATVTETKETEPSQTVSAEVSASETVAEEELPDIEPMTLKWSTAVAEAHPAVPLLEECFEKINEETNGKITIELFSASTLGTENETTEMVRAGTIFGATLGQQMFESYYPAIAAENLPFTFSSPEECYTYFNEYSKDNVWNTDISNATGMHFIGGVIYGMRHLTTTDKEVKSPKDAADIMIRSMESEASMCQVTSLGGTPMPIAYSELYLALQTGTVDGQENPVANILEKKFYEVQDYLVLTGHAINIVVQAVNQEIWDTIPEAYQLVIEGVFNEYDQKIVDTMIGSENSGIEELEGYGMTVIPRDMLDMDAFHEAADASIQEYFGDNDELLAYREAVLKWLTENMR